MSKLDEIIGDISVEVAYLNYELSDEAKKDLKGDIKRLLYEIIQKEFDYEITAEQLAEAILVKTEAL